jgi:hypothetical protein
MLIKIIRVWIFSKHIVEQAIDARLEEFNGDFHGSPLSTGRNG